jgi:hypothetical protein
MKIKPLKSALVLEVVRREIVSAGLVFVFGLVSLGYAQDAATTLIPVDSSAFVFSPGNWVGDEGRGGEVFRQTWNPGAYFRVTWESGTNVVPRAHATFAAKLVAQLMATLSDAAGG